MKNITRFLKSSSLVCRASRVESIDIATSSKYNTLQFDQHSRLAILLNIFRFLAETLKTNLEKSFKYFEELIETNPFINKALQYD